MSAAAAAAAGMTGARAATSAAVRVLLERSPYVPWAAQRSAFARPVVDGVVHPDLPTWGDGDHRGDAIPRIARLSKTEAASTPSWHAQTIAGSRTATMEDAREKMMLASASGASALMLVSGDGGGDGGSNEKLTSVALLREASRLRDRGDIDADVLLMCAANPAMDGDSVRALEEKLDAGARVVVTQPWGVAPAAARRWWDSVKAKNLDADAEIIVGLHLASSSASLARWIDLCGLAEDSDDEDSSQAEAAGTLREWEARERDMDASTFRAWADERCELHLAEALADDRVDGVHLMPITIAGYAAAVRIFGAAASLASLRRGP